MSRSGHGPSSPDGGYWGVLIPQRVPIMEYAIIFMLFFAILAAGWFYLQRAKVRDAAAAPTATDEPRSDA